MFLVKLFNVLNGITEQIFCISLKKLIHFDTEIAGWLRGIRFINNLFIEYCNFNVTKL